MKRPLTNHFRLSLECTRDVSPYCNAGMWMNNAGLALVEDAADTKVDWNLFSPAHAEGAGIFFIEWCQWALTALDLDLVTSWNRDDVQEDYTVFRDFLPDELVGRIEALCEPSS